MGPYNYIMANRMWVEIRTLLLDPALKNLLYEPPCSLSSHMLARYIGGSGR